MRLRILTSDESMRSPDSRPAPTFTRDSLRAPLASLSTSRRSMRSFCASGGKTLGFTRELCWRQDGCTQTYAPTLNEKPADAMLAHGDSRPSILFQPDLHSLWVSQLLWSSMLRGTRIDSLRSPEVRHDQEHLPLP